MSHIITVCLAPIQQDMTALQDARITAARYKKLYASAIARRSKYGDQLDYNDAAKYDAAYPKYRRAYREVCQYGHEYLLYHERIVELEALTI